MAILAIASIYPMSYLILGKPPIVKINGELYFTTAKEFNEFKFEHNQEAGAWIIPDSFKYFTNLRQLTLFSIYYDNIDFLKGMTKMEVLIYTDKDTPLDFKLIKDMKKLKYLDTDFATTPVSGDKITNWSYVANLVSLEGLYVPNKGITDLSPLANLHNLKFINISGNNEITDYSVLLELDNIITVKSSDGQIPEDMLKKIKEKTDENRARREKEGLSND